MRENRLYGSEGGGTELNRSSLPLSVFGRGHEKWKGSELGIGGEPPADSRRGPPSIPQADIA